MPHLELTGGRKLTYSAWHRAPSIARFVGDEIARSLTMIDVDCVEMHKGDPIALVEVAVWSPLTEQAKQVHGTAKLAKMAGIFAYAALYVESATKNETDQRWPDIDSFRIRRLWPNPANEYSERNPAEWAEYLHLLRTDGDRLYSQALQIQEEQQRKQA